MAAPTAAGDSYSTAMNTPLTVAAPGVLANDTGTGTVTAVYVAASATNGTVSLASDGSFTFTPTTNYVGTASFSYKARNADGDSAPVTVSITVGDSLEWAHLTSAAEGQASVQGEGRGKTVWSVRSDKRNRTHAEILASPKLPQPGDPLRRFVKEAGTYTITQSYEADGAVVSDTVVVVLVEARQEADNPWLWTVTVHYEGKSDPTAELPEVSSHETEFVDYRTADIYGRPVTNSAFDVFDGGMPVDDAVDSIVITRNLPYDAWNTEMKAGYRNTLNLAPFTLGNQVDENGDPIVLPPGVVRLKRITEQRMVRSAAATVAAAKFYWRVTAELVIDRRTFRQYDAMTGDPADVPVKHRWVVADAGFNYLASGIKQPIYFTASSRPTEPQLLNGAGGLLSVPSANAWPKPAAPSDTPDICAATNKVYQYPASGTLTVAATGLLEDCYSTTGDTADLTAHLVGSVTGGSLSGGAVSTNGSFTFTRTGGFNGYASFQYKVRASADAATDSAPATVVIFCGVTPVLLAFDRYEYKDWFDLAALLENW